MKKHRAFWREVRKRAFAWLLVCLLVIGIVKPLEYGYATSSGEPQNVAETSLEGGEENQSGQEDSDIIIETLSEEESELDLLSASLAPQTFTSDIVDGESTSELNDTSENETDDVSEDSEDMKKGPLKVAPAPKGIDWSSFTFGDIADPDSFDWMGIDWAAITPGIVNWNKVKWLEIDFKTFMELVYAEYDVESAISDDASLAEFEQAWIKLMEEETDIYGDVSLFADGEDALKSDVTSKFFKGTGDTKEEVNENLNFDNLDESNNHFTMEFSWQKEKFGDLVTSVRYELPLPTSLTAPDSLNGFWLPISEGDGDPNQDAHAGNRLGQLFISDGKIYIQFTEAGLNHARSSGTTIGFSCKLNASKENADSNGAITVDLGGDKQYKITVESLKPSVPPSIAKVGGNGAKLNGNVATWKITYNPGDPNNSEANLPSEIKDTFKNTIMKYSKVTNVTVGGDSKTLPYVTADRTTSGEYDEVSFKMPNTEDWKKIIEITYETVLTDKEILNLINKTYTNTPYSNTVQAYKGTEPKTDSKTATVSPTDAQKNPFGKAFKSYDPVSKKVTWEIKVNIIGDSIPSNLTVTDEIPATAGWLSNIADVKVNDKDASSNVSFESDNKKFILNLAQWINADTANKNTKGEYAITYTTVLSDDAVGKAATELNTNALNNAKLDVTNTAGTATQNASAVVLATAVTDSLIKKEIINGSEKAADGSGRLFKYKIIVNGNRRPVKDSNNSENDGKITVSDELKNSDLEYFITNVEFAHSGGTSNEPVYYYNTLASEGKESVALGTTACKSFEVNLSGMDAQSCEITVTVKLTDPRVFGGTYKAVLSNQAFAKTTTRQDASEEVKHEFQLTKPHAKNMNTYNPETQEVVWRISINQDGNAIATGDVTLIDTLPAGMEYVRSYFNPPTSYNTTVMDITNDATSASDYESKGIQWEGISGDVNSGQTLQWKVNIKQPTRYDICVVAKLKFDDSIYTSATGKTYTNKAKIITRGVESEVSSSLTFPKQHIADKQGVVESGNKIKYTVGINPLKQAIDAGANMIKLSDKLSPNLLLDVSTVKVYKATVAMANGVSEGENVTLGGYSYSKVSEVTPSKITYIRATNVLDIDMPITDDNTTYVLEYYAYATSFGELDNTITVSGVKESVNDLSGKKLIKFDASAYSSAFKFSLPPGGEYVSLQIDKVDASGDPIIVKNGAEMDNDHAAQFEIYDAKDGGHLLGTVVANSKGVFVIEKNKLDGLDSVWLKETRAPDGGYESIDSMIEVAIADFDKGITVKNFKNSDTKGTANLTVLKVDETGFYVDALSGTGFTLYSDAECNTIAKAEQVITSALGTTFTGLTEGVVYYLKETITPSGYMTSEVKEVLAGTVTEKTIENYKLVKLTLKKEDPSGNFVAGAKVTIYKDEEKTIVAKGDIGAGEVSLSDIEIPSTGLEISLGAGTYWIEESTVPTNYNGAEVKKVEITADTTETIVNTKKPSTTPDPPGGIGGDGPDDSSTPETTAPPVKPAVKTDANGNKLGSDGKIPQTGQLWWPVWLMGGLGSLFLILGFLWKPKKKK